MNSKAQALRDYLPEFAEGTKSSRALIETGLRDDALRRALRDGADEIERLMEVAFVRSRSAMTGRMPEAYSDDELAKMFAPWWDRQDTTGLDPREVRLLQTVVDRNLQLREGRKLTCVYCGHEYPFDDVSADQLDKHIKTCEKHPLFAATMELTTLRQQLQAAREGLEKIVVEDEDQASAWGGEEGDPDNVEYHTKRAAFARATLETIHAAIGGAK